MGFFGVLAQKEMDEKSFSTFFLPAYEEVIAKFGEAKKVRAHPKRQHSTSVIRTDAGSSPCSSRSSGGSSSNRPNEGNS